MYIHDQVVQSAPFSFSPFHITLHVYHRPHTMPDAFHIGSGILYVCTKFLTGEPRNRVTSGAISKALAKQNFTLKASTAIALVANAQDGKWVDAKVAHKMRACPTF